MEYSSKSLKGDVMKKFLAAILLASLMLIPSSYATIGYVTNPNMRVWDATGTKVLTGGYVVTCPPGTTCGCTSFTSKTTYTDSTGLVANTNPVLLDSTGSASIWYDGTAKLTACNSFGAVQWTRDNVPSTATIPTSALSEWLSVSATPTYISGSQFSVLGDYTSTYTVGRRVKITQSTGDIYATVTASTFSAGVTTITVIVDSGTMTATITATSISLLDVTNPSIYIKPVVAKTTGYTFVTADINKTFEFNISTSVTATLMSGSTVPSGSFITIKNIGTVASAVNLVGNIDSRTTTALVRNSALTIYSNGTATWSEANSNTVTSASTFTSDVFSFVTATLPTGSGGSGFWHSASYGNGNFIAVSGNTGTTAGISRDGAITWTATTLPATQSWYGVAYGGGSFVAIGTLGASPSTSAAYSTDYGATWTLATVPSGTWQGIAYGNGTFVSVDSSVASTKAIYSTTGGVTWAASTLPAVGYWTPVAYGEGLFVTATSVTNNSAAYSTNGVTWQSSTMSSSQWWSSIAYGNGTFVAVATNGTATASYSLDGVNWVASTLPSVQNWRCVTYGNGIFLATSSTTVAAVSKDGIAWATRTLPASDIWYGCTYGNGTFLTTGNTHPNAARAFSTLSIQ